MKFMNIDAGCTPTPGLILGLADGVALTAIAVLPARKLASQIPDPVMIL